MYSQKYMSISEFRKKGYLQEVNRQFFHPLGMALAIMIDDEGNESLSHVFVTDDPEGYCFDNIDIDKLEYVQRQQSEFAKVRMETLGFVVQELA